MKEYSDEQFYDEAFRGYETESVNAEIKREEDRINNR